MRLIKILLAEDDSDDQFFFNDFLKKRPDLIVLPMLSNGVEVIEYMEKNRATPEALPDLIVLDQNMPKMTGLQTLEVLKKNGQNADIAMMIYSTYMDENLVKQSLALGAATVMLKPLDYNGYHKMIDDFLNLVST